MTAASDVRSFKSIVTLIIFILTNVVVVFPFCVPLPLPASWLRGMRKGLVKARILDPLTSRTLKATAGEVKDGVEVPTPRIRVPINFATAPVISVLFLLACTAIGRKEVHDGILGSDGIVPISIMAFFLALAYIAISLDHTGLIRWLAVWVLKKGGGNGRLLYFFLYLFYFGLGTLFGNDPIILSGTPFIAYMTQASRNIKNPRAWIFAQFACANVASAILVSSNPTNLVLSGAFGISYITYTANMIVPVVITGLVLFPALLWVIFPREDLIPHTIDMHVLPGEKESLDTIAEKDGSEITHADVEAAQNNENQIDPADLEAILDPVLDKPAAIFCLVLFVITLAVLLATNAAGLDVQVYAITVPAAFVMLCRDIIDDWFFRPPKKELEEDSVEGKETNKGLKDFVDEKGSMLGGLDLEGCSTANNSRNNTDASTSTAVSSPTLHGQDADPALSRSLVLDQPQHYDEPSHIESSSNSPMAPHLSHHDQKRTMTVPIIEIQNPSPTNESAPIPNSKLPSTYYASPSTLTTPSSSRTSLSSLFTSLCRKTDSKFPRAYSVLTQLPYPLLPFTFGMFILVQGLVTKGWVQIFANGWAGWVGVSGTTGAVFGMGLVSVLLCNGAGTNIGATIVLSRVLQEWLRSHDPSDRTKSAAIYAMALGVNYGAFSVVFSASLAGLLWRSILDRKGIKVSSFEFVRHNVGIIAVSMAVGCAVLLGQVYIVKDGKSQ